ncbi:MAG: hypothetical protein J6M07_01875, partial [Ruminococcus sp.]|nr:hypothetical protein [Ruminococcus sp.]
MKVKKMLAFAASLAVCTAMFAGCGSSGSGDTTAPKSEDTGNTADAGEAKTDAGSGDLIKVGIINNDPN